MMSKRFVAAVVVGCSLAGLSAGSAAQSVFGLDFLGEHRFAGSARALALGFSSFALPDTSSALSGNAATLSALPRLTFSVFEMLGASTVRTGETTAHENRFELPSVMVAVPLRRGLVAGFGYRTRFEGKGDFTFFQQVDTALAAKQTYGHRSSLFNVPLVLSWAVADWASVAGEFQVERGSISDAVSIGFNADNYATMVSKRMRRFSGASWAASVLLQPAPRLSLGASFNSKIDYSVTEDFSYTIGELDSTAAFDFSLPASYGIGAAAGLTRRWWLSAYVWQRKAPEPSGFPQLTGAIDDERLVAAGLERRGAAEGGLFARIPIRVGFYEDRWHLELPAGKPVRSRFFTLGTGFNLPGGPGSIDLSLALGQIGSLGDNGLDERVVRFGVGISAGETWSKRRPEH
jgi:hypothetical protein